MVYFIQGSITKNIKIGYVKCDVRSKLGSMQSSDPLVCLATVEGSEPEEEEIHDQFRHLHSHREWFLPGLDLLAFIDSLPSTHDTGIKQSKVTPWSMRMWNRNAGRNG